MIIKSTRVTARGGGLKRIIAHVENADDNEEVVSLRGNFADLWDARSDALRYGHQYAARHWIVSPASDTSNEEMLKAVDLLSVEFGFDPAKAVVRGHKKAKSVEALFDRHIHVLVPETDPITGRILSSAHDYLRNEKIARIWEFGREPFVRGAHLKPVIAALASTPQHTQIAAALAAAFPENAPKPAQAFDTASAQRLKRAGFDLPALRAIVAKTWDAAATRHAFEASLFRHGLTVRVGDKSGVYIITAADGTKVGSLARLAKVTKAAVLAKMERHNAGPQKAHDGRSDIQKYSIAPQDDRTDPTACGASTGQPPSESDWDDVRYDQQVAGQRPPDHREAGQADRVADYTGDREGDQGYAENVVRSADFALGLGLSAYASRLHAMLAVATRNALPQGERVVVELAEIEDEAMLAKSMVNTQLPEPPSLSKARARVATSERNVQVCQAAANLTMKELSQLQQTQSWWRRAVGFVTGENARRATALLAARSANSKAQLAFKRAREDRISANARLDVAIRLHRDAAREHQEKWKQHAVDADARISAVRSAQELWNRLPGAVATGAAGLCGLGARLSARRRSRRPAPRGSGEPSTAFHP